MPFLRQFSKGVILSKLDEFRNFEITRQQDDEIILEEKIPLHYPTHFYTISYILRSCIFQISITLNQYSIVLSSYFSDESKSLPGCCRI